MNKLLRIFFLVMLNMLLGTSLLATEKSLNIDELLNKMKTGQYQQTQENKKREVDFAKRKSEQEKLLKIAYQQRDKQVNRSEKLETSFEEKEISITNLETALNNRLGSLKELFGVLQQVTGDMSNKFESSLISAEYQNRSEFLDQLAKKMGSSSELASIEEIERVWFEMTREITESGKVVSFEREVTQVDGSKSNQTVTRVGTFSLVSNGHYLEWLNETNSTAELMRQPSSRYLGTIKDLEASTEGFTGFALDPTGGSILNLLVQAPSIMEKVEQGGTVGYVILILGFIAFIISIERYISLYITKSKVKKQLKSTQLQKSNPLGRVLLVKEKYSDMASETLELKLHEAILKELPALTRNITFIKIISVVAPLLGLLGTVTGMIQTFQAITLFGTGDPKLMAGGISQALVTTVLGLVVAIPTVMLFTWLNTRSKNIMHILQEQAAGLIAERAERES
jgi:biopolymer transport protein ExbB